MKPSFRGEQCSVCGTMELDSLICGIICVWISASPAELTSGKIGIKNCYGRILSDGDPHTTRVHARCMKARQTPDRKRDGGESHKRERETENRVANCCTNREPYGRNRRSVLVQQQSVKVPS